ncbi:DUF3172 domain-containing protein [Chroococcidiopsis sp. CCALA 051]|uniref:DUF3172 domain-containing protein n=1 Tax=Chroococcidiopsis sp. CCALA 051 TaxID=869949 RepID=UPI000D0D2816|nr:DUF3172 domain-containing protein [Chroococcidiopsis sp. CCALA 051]PSM50400.1 DUF3172 domain-containing protein [Chroococcidiopsis sp. CCALA 051]
MKSKQLNAPTKSISSIWNYASLAIVAAALMVGIGLGVGLSSSVNFSPENVASSQYIDLAAPDPQVCVQYGASAMTLDARLFVTLKPFSVYISQPKMQPGCVIRRNDWAVLEQKNLVTATQEQECKNRMNTFGFTGTLENSPQIDCVYQNNAAGNLFLKQAGISQQAR